MARRGFTLRASHGASPVLYRGQHQTAGLPRGNSRSLVHARPLGPAYHGKAHPQEERLPLGSLAYLEGVKAKDRARRSTEVTSAQRPSSCPIRSARPRSGAL